MFSMDVSKLEQGLINGAWASSHGRPALGEVDLNKGRYIQGMRNCVDTSSISTASENTVPVSRPLSYREMKKNGGFSPIVAGLSRVV